MALYAVRDYLADGVDFDKLVSTPASFEQPLVTGAVQAYDGLSCNLVDCMRDAFEEGGRYEFEVTRLDQFLYSPSAPAGRQAIMADVEPFEVGTFSTPEVRVVEPALMKFEVMELLNGYLYLAEDILELQSLSDTTLASRQKMLDALQTLPAVPHDELDWFNVNDATRRMVICMRENDLEGMKAVKRVIESGEDVAAEAEE